MKALRTALTGLSQREQIMLLILMLVLLGMGYNLFRYQPLKAEIDQLESQVTKVKADLKAAKIPRDPPYERSRLEKKLAEVEQQLLDVQTQLAPLEGRFVPLEDDDAILTLKLDISNLAKASGVDIRDNQPYRPDAKDKTKAPSSSGLITESQTLYERFLHGDPYDRPLQRLRLAGSFAGLQRFFVGLTRLPNKVLVLLFRIETAGQPVTPTSPQPLSSTVILAL